MCEAYLGPHTALRVHVQPWARIHDWLGSWGRGLVLSVFILIGRGLMSSLPTIPGAQGQAMPLWLRDLGLLWGAVL